MHIKRHALILRESVTVFHNRRHSDRERIRKFQVTGIMLFFAFISLIPFVTSKIPDGFILDVSVDCKDGSSDAVVKITSDMMVKFKAECGNMDKTGKIEGTKVSTTLNIKYGTEPGEKGSSGECYFKNPDDDSGMSFIKLNLYYGQNIKSVVWQDETHMITCLSKAMKKGNILPNTAVEKFQPDAITNVASGLSWTGTITFKLVDILDRNLDTKTIPFGKKVQLKAVVSGTGGTDSAVASDCLAIGTTDTTVTYSILRAGCGDGAVFTTTQGFTTSGDTIRSPFFEFFPLSQQLGLKFSCNFTGCGGNCDGSSCVTGLRKKRSVEDELNPEIRSRAEVVRDTPIQTDLSKKESQAFSWVTVSSQPYICLPEDKARMSKNISLTVTICVLGTLTLIATVLSLYLCVMHETSKQVVRLEKAKA